MKYELIGSGISRVTQRRPERAIDGESTEKKDQGRDRRGN